MSAPDRSTDSNGLPADVQAVMRGGTEAPWSAIDILNEKRTGVYTCRRCGAELFRSSEKFESGCGWPSFFDPHDTEAVTLSTDKSFGMSRTEVRCANCGAHLGHVFDDAPQTPTGQRYCINGIVLHFSAEEK